MDSKIRKHIFEQKNNERKNKLENRLILKRELLLNNNTNDEINKKYSYLDKFDNQEIIKINLIKWENQSINKNQIKNLYESIKSDDKIQIYYGMFFLEKLLKDDYDLINDCIDNDILNYLNKYLLDFKEPELQYIIINCIFHFTQGEEYIYNSIVSKNILNNLLEILKINILKFKNITLLIFANFAQENNYYSKLVYDLDILNYCLNEIYSLEKNDVDSEYNINLISTILSIISKQEIKDDEKIKILKIVKSIIMNSNKLKLIIDSIYISSNVLNVYNNDEFKDEQFLIRLNNTIKMILDKEDYLYDCLCLICRLSFFENIFSNNMLKSGFNILIVPILKSGKNIDLMFQILNNFISSSRNEFELLLNIPQFYDLLWELFKKENNIKMILEMVKFFATFSIHIKEEDLQFLFDNNYFEALYYYFKIDSNQIILKTILQATKNFLELDQTIGKKRNQNPIKSYLIEHNITDILENLQTHSNDNIYNSVFEILDTYFEVTD